MSFRLCFLSVKAIISNLRSFISGTVAVIFLNVIQSLTHRRLEEAFLGAPSQDRARQTDCLTYALKKLVWTYLLLRS